MPSWLPLYCCAKVSYSCVLFSLLPKWTIFSRLSLSVCNTSALSLVSTGMVFSACAKVLLIMVKRKIQTPKMLILVLFLLWCMCLLLVFYVKNGLMVYFIKQYDYLQAIAINKYSLLLHIPQ